MEIFNNKYCTGDPLFQTSKEVAPETDSANLSATNLDVNLNIYYAKLTITDIFDNNNAFVKPFGAVSIKQIQSPGSSFKKIGVSISSQSVVFNFMLNTESSIPKEKWFDKLTIGLSKKEF